MVLILEKYYAVSKIKYHVVWVFHFVNLNTVFMVADFTLRFLSYLSKEDNFEWICIGAGFIMIFLIWLWKPIYQQTLFIIGNRSSAGSMSGMAVHGNSHHDWIHFWNLANHMSNIFFKSDDLTKLRFFFKLSRWHSIEINKCQNSSWNDTPLPGTTSILCYCRYGMIALCWHCGTINLILSQCNSILNSVPPIL